jgi:catechol 2,3-dioxygenase-like lactoylglutathione lyase family enzyme
MPVATTVRVVTANPIKLTGATPVLPVKDPTAAVAFYTGTLGFTLAFEQGPYAGVVRDGVLLHLDGDVNQGAGLVTCRIETEGVDELHGELEPAGVVDPAEPIRTTPWGHRQFSVLDGDGNRITFVRSTS